MADPVALYQAAQGALRASRNEEARRLCQQLIAAKPSFADGYFLLAIAEANIGRINAAIEVLAQAVRLAPRAEYLAHYAKHLVLAKRDAEALAAADSATSMSPTDAQTLDTIGCVYSRLGAHEKAIPLFKEAVKQQPDHHEMRYNLASSLGFSGRFDEAAGHYEKIIATRPDFVQAHSALSRLRKQSPESNHIERLETLLQRARGGVDALHLHHALAKEYEDLGDYDAAFRNLDVANRRRKAEIGYHIGIDRAIFEHTARKFQQDSYFRGKSDATADPIFIVGMPRTATTLTERILSSHPEVESAGELQAMPLAIKRLAGTASRRVLDTATLDAVSALAPATVGRMYLELAAPHRRRNVRFVDKLPLNFFYVGFIARAMPNASIVCLRRNPLDTVWSNYKHLFGTSFSYYNYSFDLLDTAAYYVMFDRLVKLWRQLFPGRLLELQYEAVVEDLEGQSRQLLAHCGLDWTDECLRFYENKSAVATPSTTQVRQPIYRSSLGRWRAYEGHLAPVREFFEAHGISV
jgi:tetratricopeptide (TPR) repeat protein